MSIVTELKYTANLDKGVCMTPIMPSFMGGDQEAHRIIVDCYRQNSREAVDLSAAGVTAYFVRADGMTIPLNGETEGNKASVLLPAACYAVMGRFSLVIKLSLGDSINTVFWGEGAVSRSRTDVVIDPDSVIPSLEELLAKIEAMEIATAAANEAAASVEGFKAEINDQVSQLSEDIEDINDQIYFETESGAVTPWEQGMISEKNGGASSSPISCRTNTNHFNFTKSGVYRFTINDAYLLRLNEYNGVPGSSTFARCIFDLVDGTVMTNIDATLYYRLMVTRKDGAAITPDSLPADAVSYNIITTMQEKISGIESEINDAATTAKNSAGMLARLVLNPCYDHLFVNRTNNMVTIPHESIYHVNISKSLGFNVIEANVQKTSDDHYFVNHLTSGTFAGFFDSADGVTDISSIRAADVTWDWIVENVRYKSNVAKYRTRPTTLEEFLIGCKQNNLIPLLKFIDNNVAELTKKIMGPNNYIVYEGTRRTAGDAIIFRWENYTTVEDIINFCDSIGAPLIYGSSKFNTSFTEAETAEIVNALHERGYYTCISYEGNVYWGKYAPLGIDFCGGTRTVNRLRTGNTYNLENIYNTDDFAVTGGSVTDNVITLEDGGSITCANIGTAKVQVAHVDLEVDYTGTLTLQGGLGEFRGDIDFNSADGRIIVCTAVINAPVKFTLVAKGSTAVINSIKYKVSLC